VLRTLDQHLDGREYVVGNALTLADIALYGYTHVAEEGGFSLEPHAAVRAWLRRVASEPGHVPIDA
jgi:glutathione S-transferase